MWSTQFKKNGENVRDTVKTVIEYYCNEKFGFNVEVFYSITGNRDFYYILFNSTDEDIVSYEDDGEEYYFERPDIIVDKSYKSFKRWLSEIKTLAGDIHAVYFEEVRRHAGVDAAHVYGGLLATLTSWCEHHNIPYQGVPVGTIKRHATGQGNAGKDAVIAAMQALGHAVSDDNEADALALLHWVLDTQEL